MKCQVVGLPPSGATCSVNARVSGQRRPEDAVLQRVIAQTYVDHHGFQIYTESFYARGLEAAHTARIGRYRG